MRPSRVPLVLVVVLSALLAATVVLAQEATQLPLRTETILKMEKENEVVKYKITVENDDVLEATSILALDVLLSSSQGRLIVKLTPKDGVEVKDNHGTRVRKGTCTESPCATKLQYFLLVPTAGRNEFTAEIKVAEMGPDVESLDVSVTAHILGQKGISLNKDSGVQEFTLSPSIRSYMFTYQGIDMDDGFSEMHIKTDYDVRGRLNMYYLRVDSPEERISTKKYTDRAWLAEDFAEIRIMPWSGRDSIEILVVLEDIDGMSGTKDFKLEWARTDRGQDAPWDLSPPESNTFLILFVVFVSAFGIALVVLVVLAVLLSRERNNNDGSSYAQLGVR